MRMRIVNFAGTIFSCNASIFPSYQKLNETYCAILITHGLQKGEYNAYFGVDRGLLKYQERELWQLVASNI